MESVTDFFDLLRFGRVVTIRRDANQTIAGTDGKNNFR
jgi:hypothetical protein